MAEAGGPVRVSFDLDRTINDRLREVLPYGLKAQTFQMVSLQLCEALEKGGSAFLGALLSGEIVFSYRPPNPQNLRGSKKNG